MSNKAVAFVQRILEMVGLSTSKSRISGWVKHGHAVVIVNGKPIVFKAEKEATERK